MNSLNHRKSFVLIQWDLIEWLNRTLFGSHRSLLVAIVWKQLRATDLNGWLVAAAVECLPTVGMLEDPNFYRVYPIQLTFKRHNQKKLFKIHFIGRSSNSWISPLLLDLVNALANIGKPSTRSCDHSASGGFEVLGKTMAFLRFFWVFVWFFFLGFVWFNGILAWKKWN